MHTEIKIYKFTNSPFAETIELGDEVFNAIKPLIIDSVKNENKIIIDFSEITSLTTKFLNNAIGNLFLKLDISTEDLMRHISFIGLDPAKKNILKWSLVNALNQSVVNERKKV